eukprot:g32990.t1
MGARVARKGQPEGAPDRNAKAQVKATPPAENDGGAVRHASVDAGDQAKPKISPVVALAVDKAHAACFENTPYPSAKKCGECHPKHYREWSVSPHAYAQLSPVFNAMSNRLIGLNNGTLGDFCIRCHTPVGMALKEEIAMSNLDRHPTSREGVTCVVCHRINQAWGKGAGRQAIAAGDIHAPISGPIGNDILADVIANSDKYSVLKSSPDPEIQGRDIHGHSQRFFQMTTSGFCGSCHDVFAPNGFRLEDAFSEFKHSPSAKNCGHNCQDCHMGKVPGRPDGYSVYPAAVVGNASTPPRKHTNHMIVGPDYSIIHPGLFPHNPKAVREEHEDPHEFGAGLATPREWLLFDHRSDWGKPAFEATNPDPKMFPAPWNDAERRKKARKILNEQQQLLDEATVARAQILREGYNLGDIEITRNDSKGVEFKLKVSNGTTGHGVPTGFDAERLVFMRVLVWNASGKLVFQSGDLDPNGDIRDSHSYYVHNGKLPIDKQLFSLQTRFLTRNVRGGEREQIVPVPYSLDPLPYTRPETRPFTVLGRPMAARKHKQNIEPCGHTWAKYHIDPDQLCGPGPYLTFRRADTRGTRNAADSKQSRSRKQTELPPKFRLMSLAEVESRFNDTGDSVVAPSVLGNISAGPVPPAPRALGAPEVDPNMHSTYRSPDLPYADPVQYDESIAEPKGSLPERVVEGVLGAIEAPAKPFAKLISRTLDIEHLEWPTELDGHPIGIQEIPDRPPLLLELNEEFLAPGFLEAGMELPTGAVWRPSLWVFGTYRSGYAYSQSPGPTISEWAQRLNLFAQLNLTGTERVVLGMRPVDQETGRMREFNSYDFRTGDSRDGWNSDVQTLFFEGDFGEIFPNLDPFDVRGLDIGFSVGRQPMSFQQGLLINEDMIDAVTVTQNTLNGNGNLNLRATGVYAWNRINRNNNMADRDAQLVGLFTESDFRHNTVNLDAAYLHSQTQLGSLFAFGASAIRRFHGHHNTYNSSLHILASFPTEGETAASGQGELLFSQFSWTRHHTEDLVYVNAFWAIDQFTSPARGPLQGGPLGQTGILFAAPGLGRFAPPLSNQATNAYGGSIGYQMFFDDLRKQVVWEIGGRDNTDGNTLNGANAAAIATGMRYQQAIGQHWIVVVDGFLAKRESAGLAPGARLEFLAKF